MDIYQASKQTDNKLYRLRNSANTRTNYICELKQFFSFYISKSPPEISKEEIEVMHQYHALFTTVAMP